VEFIERHGTNIIVDLYILYIIACCVLIKSSYIVSQRKQRKIPLRF